MNRIGRDAVYRAHHALERIQVRLTVSRYSFATSVTWRSMQLTVLSSKSADLSVYEEEMEAVGDVVYLHRPGFK